LQYSQREQLFFIVMDQIWRIYQTMKFPKSFLKLTPYTLAGFDLMTNSGDNTTRPRCQVRSLKKKIFRSPDTTRRDATQHDTTRHVAEMSNCGSNHEPPSIF
jgi:hypothetical protein